MKYRIEKRYPYSDTHCFGKSEPYLALINENGREIGHFKKCTYPSDTHCSGHEEAYEVFVENIYLEPKTAKTVVTNNSFYREKSKILTIRKK